MALYRARMLGVDHCHQPSLEKPVPLPFMRRTASARDSTYQAPGHVILGALVVGTPRLVTMC